MSMRALAAIKYPFWDKLTSQEQNRLAGAMRRARFMPDALLQAGAASCRGLLFVESGLLRVYLVSPEGREITLYRICPHDFCVLSASCILEHIHFDIHISADEPTDAVIADSSVIREIAQSNVYVENFMYKQSAERFSDVIAAMEQLLFMRFDKRLAVFLLNEKNRTGRDAIQLTHEQIGRQVGSAREVVSRMLARFARDGWVEPFRGGVRILDEAALRALLRTDAL